MRKFRPTIKNKLRLVAVLVAAATAFMTWQSFVSMEAITTFEKAKTQTAVVESGMLSLQRHEEEFLASPDPTYIEKAEKEFAATMEQLDALIARLDGEGFSTVEAHGVEDGLNAFRANFDELAELQNRIGYTQDDGLRGTLRNAVHRAEGRIRELGDDGLLADMLMLRRNEKDFLLRLDEKYVGEFETNYKTFTAALGGRELSGQVQRDVTASMKTYHDQFLDLVSAMRRKGLSQNDGLHGDVRGTVAETEALLAKMVNDIDVAADARSTRLTQRAVLVAVLISGVLLGLIVLISRNVGRRVNLFGRVVQEIRETDDLSRRFRSGVDDEFEEMGSHFNAMMERFSRIIREVVDAVERLSASAGQLSAITQQTSSGMRSQQQETDSVATAMNEMEATVEEIARATADAATAAQEADGNAQQGKAVVDRAVNAINALASELEKAGTVMSKLEEESDGVTTILDVIREIAEQTNLLALNAAIEAARAGEQGRGFAVVADEVRTLARRTQESTEEIQSMIERLQKEAHEAVAVMERGRLRGEETVSEAAQAAEALRLITDGVASITDKNTHIASASEQQRSVTEEVNRNIASIKTVTDETVQSVDQIASSSHELADVAQRLNSTVHRFRKTG